MVISWLSLVPAFVVISLATLTHSLNKALIAGIASAALIFCNGTLTAALALVKTRTWQQLTNLDNLYLYTFLITVPSLVILLNRGNGPEAFTQAVTQRVQTRRGAQNACILSSCILNIDDYLSILTTGHIMRALIDHFSIARVKLAYLIHALSGTIVILSPISSWVATITAYLQQAGISNEPGTQALIIADPFSVYLQTIWYIFYSIFTIITVIFIVQKNISFGPMHAFEQASAQQKVSIPKKTIPTGSLLELIVPLALLLITTVTGILYYGGYTAFGGTHSLLEAFTSNTEIFRILAFAGTFTLAISMFFNWLCSTISTRDIPHIIYDGYSLMKPAIIMVFLASILSLLLKNDLQTGHYLAQLCTKWLPYQLLPATFFVLSLAISLSTGSSWGTFGLMLPIAVPMLCSIFAITPGSTPDGVPLLYPVLGAIFSGGLCGDHISPFSETTVMSAVSAQVTPINHVKTQLPYALPVIVGVLVSFIFVGYSAGSAWQFAGPCAGLMLVLATLSWYNKQQR